MKKTKPENIAIAEIIGEELGITFTNCEFELDNWGYADNFCQLNQNDLLLLECEMGQKHPNTNVLKIFPYLENHRNKRIILLHYFFPENKAPKNRVALCDYISTKMEQNLIGRFQYISLHGDEIQIQHKLKASTTGLLKQLLN